MMNVSVDGAIVGQVATVTVIATYLMKKFVFTRAEPSFLSILAGAAVVVVSSFGVTPFSTVLVSGAVGVAAAGLVYDKVLKPVADAVIDFVHKTAPEQP